VDDCEPRINNVGFGAINVGWEHLPESMIVGQDGCSIASRTFNSCEPQHLVLRSLCYGQMNSEPCSWQ
jgi:hypothetical protein